MLLRRRAPGGTSTQKSPSGTRAGKIYLEGVTAAGEAGGEDHAIVGQGGGRGAVLLTGGAEGEEDGGPGDPGVGGERERVAGVVVEPGQDLGIGPSARG